MTGITDLILAKTPEELAEVRERFRAEQAAQPSNGEELTAALRQLVYMGDQAVLKTDEYADLAGGKLVVKKLN